MNSLHSTLFFAALLLAMVAGPGTGETAEIQDAKTGVEEPALCHKKLSAGGRPHRISAVASLTAVRAWAQQAKKHGADYTFWNEAESQTIKCEKLKRSDYFMCFASGKPCRAANSKKAS